MGVFAALGTALCWAIAARLFRGTGNAFSPLTMNFWKGLISIAILAVVSVIAALIADLLLLPALCRVFHLKV